MYACVMKLRYHKYMLKKKQYCNNGPQFKVQNSVARVIVLKQITQTVKEIFWCGAQWESIESIMTIEAEIGTKILLSCLHLLWILVSL